MAKDNAAPCKRLARTIMVAMRLAGREVTRRELHGCFRGMVPTNGELSDALFYLEQEGHICRLPEAGVGYLDFGGTVLRLTTVAERLEMKERNNA